MEEACKKVPHQQIFMSLLVLHIISLICLCIVWYGMVLHGIVLRCSHAATAELDDLVAVVRRAVLVAHSLQ